MNKENKLTFGPDFSGSPFIPIKGKAPSSVFLSRRRRDRESSKSRLLKEAAAAKIVADRAAKRAAGQAKRKKFEKKKGERVNKRRQTLLNIQKGSS